MHRDPAPAARSFDEAMERLPELVVERATQVLVARRAEQEL
jgi:hypothetical protein